MFCYQKDIYKPTEPVSKALFDQLVDSEQTRWLTARHRELRAALPAIKEGDAALLAHWTDDEAFQMYCLREETSTEKKGDKTRGQLFKAMTQEQRLQDYCTHMKCALPYCIFIGTYEVWEKKFVNKKTKKERTVADAWRSQEHVHLNGLVVADYDHLEGDVRKVYEQAIGRLSQTDYQRIVLAYITPSGHGLKVVFTADPEVGNLIDNQLDFSVKLGLKLDESCKDASRGAFLTTRDDILLIDERRLFDYENPAFGAKWDEAYHKGKSQATKKSREAASLRGTKQSSTNAESLDGHAPLAMTQSDAELNYHGVPYSKIINAWLNGATIEPGDRHRTSLRLADHLRYITDNDPVLIETLLRQTPFVDEIVRERNEDVSGTVESARKYQMYKYIPQQMREALEAVGVTTANSQWPTTNSQQPTLYSNADIYDQLPFEQWSQELTELAEHYPCMKALFNNVHPYKTPAIWFSTAAMFGTLMTRTWYHYWYEPETMRRLNYSIFVIGDPGAGKNVIEKFFFKICDPIIKADQVGIDAINRYKEGRTERSTSSKAQKADALKKPVVGIRVHPARTSTGEFIRHMLAAVEQVQGQTLNLHMFSFDAELDNVTKQNKGGEYKDREALEIKAFHNENDGQFYANYESVTANFNVFWNFVYTGTPYALSRKVNQRNFGTGLSTRLAVIPLPNKGMAERHQNVDPAYDEELSTWAYRLDKVEGELPVEPLNDETFDWQSSHLEIAEFNEDKAEKLLLMRIPYYGIGISLPFILMRHWDEWQEQKTLAMDEMDRRLCRLAMEIQYRCQHFFFGEMAYNYFEDQGKEFVQRRRTTRYDECFRKLPDEFKTQQFMDCFECSQPTASRSLARLLEDKVIKRVSYGVYRKTVSELH